MGNRLVYCGKDDQCEIRNCEHEACVPGCTEISQMPDSRGRVLRVEENWKSKQPYCFEVNEGELFAFAGIWDRWKNASGNLVETCSILTTTPNAVTAVVHDRMPVILDPDSYDLWLDPGMKDVGSVSELLKPCDAKIVRSFPVSTRLNQVINDDAECSAQVELIQAQNPLLF